MSKMKKSNLKYFVLLVGLFLYSNFCIGQTGTNENPGKPDILDSFIAIAIILFILGMAHRTCPITAQAQVN